MSVTIGERLIGGDAPPFVIAELSGNHQQCIEKAKALIKAAVEAGVDAVKLQTYTPDTITLPVRNELFKIEGGLWDGSYLYDLYAEAMTPWEWHKELADYASSLGVILFSTPFDESAVDFLEKEIDPLVYKVASFELNHIPMLKRIGETQKPVIMSTGMATEAEIRLALNTLNEAGANGVILLKCVSAYPADPADFNLRSMQSLSEQFKVPVGLSDHSLTHEIAFGAVAMGAAVIEKHIVLARDEGGVDSGFSLEPDEFKHMVESIQRLHRGLGKSELCPVEQDAKQKRFRRSIFVAQYVAKGEVLTEANLKIVRPSDGMSPEAWESVLGKVAAQDLEAGTPLDTSHILKN